MSRKTLRRIFAVITTSFFIAAFAIVAQGHARRPKGLSSHGKSKDHQHLGDLLYQRQRIKKNRKSVTTKSRMNTHTKPPKAPRHRMRKVHLHQNLKLRHAQKKARHHQ